MGTAIDGYITTVGALRQVIAGFVNNRDWSAFHTPKNLSTSISIEAAELMERFQWLTTEEAQAAVETSDEAAAVADELADADYNSVVGIIYCLSLSNALNLDVSAAVLGNRGLKRSVGPTNIAIPQTSSGCGSAGQSEKRTNRARARS